VNNQLPYGLSESQKAFIKKLLLTELDKFGSLKVYVFGSRAVGKQRQYSDLDLWIETQKPMGRADIEKIYELFLASDLPIKVDIVTPTTCLPEYFENIQAQKILWF